MEVASYSKKDKSTKAIYFGLIFLLTATAFYFEFVHDTRPMAAIHYYDIDTNIPPSENAAFALLGIKAPKGIDNFHSWAQLDSVKTEPLSEKLEIHTSDLLENYNCWLPWGENDQGENPRCLSKIRLNELLDKNQLALDRYSKLIMYSSIAAPRFGVMSHASIELSKQFSVALWQRRNSFSDEDLESIANFYHFWNSVLSDGYLSQIDFAIASVNHGLAFGLFSAAVTRYPEIILLYGKLHGNFAYIHDGEDLINRINLGEFFLIDSELCISGALNFKNSYCKPQSVSLLFKPGRTLSQIYAPRFRVEDCMSTKNTNEKAAQQGFASQFLKSIVRPGNFDGRIFLRLYGFRDLNCELLENFSFRNKQLGLFNLYLTLKESNYTFSQIDAFYEKNSELFLVPFSKDYYLWDANNKTLGLKNFWPEYEDIYIIPYR